jgi:hypothetical protein
MVAFKIPGRGGETQACGKDRNGKRQAYMFYPFPGFYADYGLSSPL